MRARSVFFTLLGASLAVAGCKDEQKCNQARGANASAWEEVKNDAARFKLHGATGYDELSESQKKSHYDTFSSIEAQAQIVFESFASTYIAWNNATKARDKAKQDFDAYFAKSSYAGFGGKLDSAQKSFSEAEAACR
jgi:hypothetical protein